MTAYRRALPLAAGLLLMATAAHAQEVIDTQPERSLVPSQSVSVRQRSHPEWDPLGIRIGALRGDASVGLSAGYVSNERGLSDSSGEAVFAVSPAFNLETDWARNGLAISGRSDSFFYSENSDDNATDYDLALTGHFDFARGTILEGGASVAHVVVGRDFLDTPRDLINPKEYDVETGGLQLKTEAGPLQLALGGVYEHRDYSSQLGYTRIYDFNVQDLNRYTIIGTAAYPIGPRLGVYANVEQQFRRYIKDDPITGSRDSDSRSFLVGIVYESPALIRADLGFGYQTAEYSGANDGLSSSGLRFKASVEYFLNELTTVSLNASRRSDVSEILTSPGRTTTSGELRVDHELLRNLIISGSVTGRLDEYDLSNGEDRYVGLIAQADYKLNRRWSANLLASYLNVDSNRNISDNSFDDLRFVGTLTFHY